VIAAIALRLISPDAAAKSQVNDEYVHPAHGSAYSGRDGLEIELRCEGYNSISIVRGELDVPIKPEQTFSQAQLMSLLARQGHHGSLSRADALSKIEKFMVGLGYKVTVLEQARAYEPFPVIFDSRTGGHLERPEFDTTLKVKNGQ
jgi:hypothetical protein